MKDEVMTETDQGRRTLALYTAGFMLLLAILACGAATVDNVRVLDVPQYICPSDTPPPTHTQPPTRVQPYTQVPPSGFVTNTPYPGCVFRGARCVTHTPHPGGVYSTPGYVVPGATSTPRATLTPWPTPTAYVVTGGFHLGADVYTGGVESPVRLRLRLDDVETVQVEENRQVVAWAVEIENVGEVPYYGLPGAQVFVANIQVDEETLEGQWWASQEAASAVGIRLQPEALDVLEVLPGDAYRLTLTAFTPVGEPTGFGWALDPLSGGRDGDLTGGSVAYWTTGTDPACSGNIGPGATVPTPAGLRPTPTPSATPAYPPWCTWCGG
jgi:hypothetical protein